jgi:hypothetical protein
MRRRPQRGKEMWMSTGILKQLGLTGTVLLGLCLLPAARAVAQDKGGDAFTVPVVMEEATVRGRVVILETRREDRKVIEGLAVQIWSTKEAETTARRRWARRNAPQLEPDQLLHETETDELGIFDLPELDIGDYILKVSGIQFRLTVIKQSEERAGQSEPKVLLILIPKEVVKIQS